MQEENETSQMLRILLQEEFNPLRALKSHLGFLERLMKTPGNLAAVEAWLGTTLAELKGQGYT